MLRRGQTFTAASLPLNSQQRFPASDPKLTEPTTRTITDSEQQKPGVSQSQNEGNQLVGLCIYLVHGEGVVEPLNVPARNAVAHKNPALVKDAIAKALQRQANKEGFYEDEDCVVYWKPSAIPFHIEFEISASNKTCQHLASVRNSKAKDQVSTQPYAHLIDLKESGPVCKKYNPTGKDFLEQATRKSAV